MNIRLSKKHGVNPSLMYCYICGEEFGVALVGRLPGDEEAPRRMTNTNTLCERCRKVIDNGAIFIIEVKDGESGNNPLRTGRLIGLKEAAWKRFFTAPIPDGRISFMENTPYEMLFSEIEHDTD